MIDILALISPDPNYSSIAKSIWASIIAIVIITAICKYKRKYGFLRIFVVILMVSQVMANLRILYAYERGELFKDSLLWYYWYFYPLNIFGMRTLVFMGGDSYEYHFCSGIELVIMSTWIYSISVWLIYYLIKNRKDVREFISNLFKRRSN